MPRAKRALTEKSANAQVPTQGTAKRQKTAEEKTSKSSKTANARPSASNQAITGRSGKKDGAQKAQPAASKKSGTKSAFDSSQIDLKKWKCLCRGAALLEDPHRDDDEEEEDEAGGTDEKIPRCDEGKTCICQKRANEHPGHPFVISEKGLKTFHKWIHQADVRDQDAFGVYMYNDFTGYGVCEVVENMILAFNTQVSKKDINLLEFWSHVEGMAMFCQFLIMSYSFHMVDDSEGNKARLMIMGTALLTALDVFADRGVFEGQASKIPNVGMVVSLFMLLAHAMLDSNDDNQAGWTKIALEKCEKFGVHLENEAEVKKLVAKVEEDIPDDDDDDEDADARSSKATKARKLLNMQAFYEPEGYLWGYRSLEGTGGACRSWDSYDWKKELQAYTQHYGKSPPGKPWSKPKIGGNHYDLTTREGKASVKQQQARARVMFGNSDDDSDD